jgi:hypothetical protein
MTKSMRIEWEEHAARMEKKRNAHRVLVGKQEVKKRGKYGREQP